MKTLVHFAKLKPLMRQACFSTHDARTTGVHPALLAYYLKTGRLNRLKRGLYKHATASMPTSLRWGDLLQALHSIPQGIVCLTTALIIYGYSEEIARQYWIAISHGTTAKSSKLIKIVRLRNTTLGKSSILLDGVKVSIFDRERTIIDAFRLLGHETAIKALKIAINKKGSEKIDLVKLQHYAKKLRVNITPYLMAMSS